MGEEQGRDELGNALHVDYERDEQFKATRIPSGRSKESGGGSFGFDPAALDVEQNIISCDGEGHTVVAKVTAEQLNSAPPTPEHTMARDRPLQSAEIASLQASAEEYYKRAMSPAPMGEAAPVLEEPDQPLAPSMSPDVLDVAEPAEQERPAVPEILQRAATSAAAQPAQQPILVTFSAAFGKVTQPYSTLFRDGICLVLVTDHRQLSNLYTLPDIDDEPMDVTVQANNRELACVWAGIQFTMPSVPVTFTVLLVKEERNIE